MGHKKKLVGLCVGLMMILSGSIAVAHDRGGGKTKVLKIKHAQVRQERDGYEQEEYY